MAAQDQNKHQHVDQISVFYDGLCHLCSREIDHYKQLQGAENIRFVDITSPAFKPELEHLDPVVIHRHLHAKDRSGQLHIGVDAFICIWNELPRLKFLLPIAKFKPIYKILSGFYVVFAKVRPLLPKKSCEASPYCEPARK